MKSGTFSYKIANEGDEVYVDTMEDARYLIEVLTDLNGPPWAPKGTTLWSHGPIRCFRVLCWDTTFIPVQSFIWDRETRDWTEEWTGDAAAHGILQEERQQRMTAAV